MNPTASDLTWRKSRRSGQEDNCVEVATLPGGGYAVRDSKNPNGPTLPFTAREWKAFLDRVKNSEVG